jgi:tRNA modification GTPase
MDSENPDVKAATWIACLTPSGQGAIATLALHGPHAWDVVRQVFRPRKGELPSTPQRARFWLGRLGGEVHDDAVLAVKRVEPTCWLELHVHGGREVVRYLHDLFVERGVESCSWPDFLRLTSADPLQALAAAALAEAPTARTAAILLDQYHGAFRRALQAIDTHLERGDAAAALGIVEELARFAPLGRHLTTPWRVVIAGAPNVGKSSLLNALAGYQRSIVAPTPGTTRDLVTVRLAIDGWPVEFVDTAGLRDAAETLEGQGIEQARAIAGAADLCLWVLDASATPQLPETMISGVRLIVNKTDLPCQWSVEEAGAAVRVSARSGEGIADLCECISRWLLPESPAAGAAVPFTPELADTVIRLVALFRDALPDSVELERIRRSLGGGLSGLDQGVQKFEA